jgi:hypothetical protein
MNYWGEAAIDSEKCACGMSNRCKSSLSCNCDSNVVYIGEDSGFLNDTITLPVTQLWFGNTDADSEFGFHTLGRLRNWGERYSVRPSNSPKKKPFQFILVLDIYLARKNLKSR